MEKSQRTDIVPISSIHELLNQYLSENLLRPASVHNYRSVVAMMTRECFDGLDISLTEVKPEQLVAWRTTVLERASPATWNNYRRHLSALFNYAVMLGVLPQNPLKRVRSAPSTKKKKRTIDPQELSNLIKLLDQHTEGSHSNPGLLFPHWFWRTAIKTLYYTGIRRRQLVNLYWEDIDLATRVIHLRSGGSKTHREWQIPMADELVADLEEVLRHTLAHSGNQSQEDILERQVFQVSLFHPRYKHGLMTEAQLSGFFRRLSEHSGVRISSHRMRHTLATELMRGENPDIKGVQSLLGHTDIRVTLGYIETDVSQLRHLMGRLRPI